MSPTLIGVLIGATATLASISLQLWFSSRQRERDRYMQLRRDVYLEAADGLAALLEYLQQSARVDISFGKAETSLVRQGWLFKTYLVASTDTLIAMNKANAAAAAAALDLIPHRLAISEIESDIAIVKVTLSGIEQFQTEIRNEAQATDIANPSEQSLKRLEWLKGQLDESWKQRRDESSRLEALTNEHAKRLREFLQRSMQISFDTQTAIRSALLEARSELEVAIDFAKFRPATAAVDAKMREKLAQTVALIQVGDASDRN